jgi:hypothetical protein
MHSPRRHSTINQRTGNRLFHVLEHTANRASSAKLPKASAFQRCDQFLGMQVTSVLAKVTYNFLLLGALHVHER